MSRQAARPCRRHAADVRDGGSRGTLSHCRISRSGGSLQLLAPRQCGRRLPPSRPRACGRACPPEGSAEGIVAIATLFRSACPRSPSRTRSSCPACRAANPTSQRRPVDRVVPAHHAVEGAGFEVWRPFPGGIDAHIADPFFLLDQLGPVELRAERGRRRAVAPAPRVRDRHLRASTASIAHHDSNGGGGVIGEGDTQWMTAGVGHPARRGPHRVRSCDRAAARTACSCG